MYAITMTANDSLAPNLAVVILHGRNSPIPSVNRPQCAHDSPNPRQGRNARYPRIDRGCSDRGVIPAFPLAVGRVEDQVNLTVLDAPTSDMTSISSIRF